MKRIIERGLLNLWNYCIDNYDENDRADYFFKDVCVMVAIYKHKIDFKSFMNFVEKHNIGNINSDINRANPVKF